MTNQEISRRLALAIGYAPEDVRAVDDESEGPIVQAVCRLSGGYKYWRTFDFSSPSVIWPVAARYNAFPHKWTVFSPWQASTGLETDRPGYEWHKAATPERAVALAVIAAAERGVLK